MIHLYEKQMCPQNYKNSPAKISQCLSDGGGLLDDISSSCCLVFTVFYPKKFF